MTRIWLHNGVLLDPERRDPTPGNLLIDGERGTILEADGPDARAPEGARSVDLQGRCLAPGFLDLHYHGQLIFLAPGEARREIARTAERLPSTGVTGFLPTTVAWGHDALLAHVGEWAALCDARHSGGPDAAATVLGLHLEGPWIRLEAAGAQPAAGIHPYEASRAAEILDRGEGAVRMVTFAPEIEGAQNLQETLCRRGIVGALGHSHAQEAHAERAIEAGASHVTHLFNAMGSLHHRDPGLCGVALTDDRLSCDLICDGVHVHPAMVRLAVRAKGERLALITDRVEPLGGAQSAQVDDAVDDAQRSASSPGSNADDAASFGAVHDDGSALRLADGTLAGSNLTLDRAVRNAVKFGGMSLLEAARAASWVPARILGLENERGSFRSGARADLVVLDPAGALVETWLTGKRVHAAS